MADDHDPRTYYLHRRADTFQGDDQIPENPGPHLQQPEVSVPVIGISNVLDFEAVTISQELGRRQVMEVMSSVLRELSAADLLRKCDDAENAGVALQIRVVEDRDRD